MHAVLSLILACGTEAPPPPDPPAPAAPAPEAPAARIGGEPILHRPVVIGAISAEAVERGLDPQRDAIARCYAAAAAASPGLAGRVLVKFSITTEGGVSTATVRSTSLRDEEVERCVLAAVQSATFAPLATGKIAIVQYPFSFGT